MFPQPEGQTGGSVETFWNQCCCGNMGALDRKVLPFFLTVGHGPVFSWLWCERGIWINRQHCWFWFNKPVSYLYRSHSLQTTGPTSLRGKKVSKWNCLRNILSHFLPPRRHAAHSLPGSVDRSKNYAFGHKTHLCISFNLTVNSDCMCRWYYLIYLYTRRWVCCVWCKS